MSEWTSFRNKVLLGYLAVMLPLSAVTAVTIGRLESIATAQLEHLRREENGITRVQRLRWNAELLVSAGRGYLISGDPTLLAKLSEVEASFDRWSQELDNEALSPPGRAHFHAVQQAALAFRLAQDELLDLRKRLEGPDKLVLRFEAELLPLRAALGQALDRLIEHKEGVLDLAYAQAERDTAELEQWTYLLLSAVTLLGFGLSFRFATLLGRSYRKEQEALDAARQAVAARDELMGILAHDLRNPLNAISLKAAVLRLGADSEKIRRNAESIEHVTASMAELVNTMLDVRTLEAGSFSVTPTPCDVGSLVQDSIETFTNLAVSKQVRLEQALPRSQLTVAADRERVLQVLSNLFGNALKFTPRGGKISLSVEQKAELVQFSVTDTGPGIDAQHLPHVFERMWKHEAGGMKGTGLGLFIAKAIVDAHGGRIWVESEPRRGSSFHFTLALAPAERQAPPPAQGAHSISPTAP
jgi:signal transduction histidine kinase